MGRRDDQISHSIILAVRADDKADNRHRFWRPVRKFFALYALFLARFRPELFQKLRDQTWKLSDEEYKSSFKDSDALVSKGDMGYSGSVSGG